jgi:hypothetical protein
MRTTSEKGIKTYTEMITRWENLKREHRIYPGDVEPDPVAFGLDEWTAKQVKDRVVREVNRTC